MKLLMYSNPKTGTSTVEYNAKEALFGSNCIIVNKPEEKHFDSLHVSELENLKFISGHRMTKERFDRIKKVCPESKTLSLFRNPAEQIVSAYNYDLNYKYGRYIPFWLWYKFLIPRNPQSSHFVRRFQGHFLKSFFLSSKHITLMLKWYDESFDYVILTEKIDEEIPLVFKTCGITREELELVRRKSTGKDYKPFLKLTDTLRIRLENDNKLDVALYQAFKNKTG